MITVRHWKRSGFSCDHSAHALKDALAECLRCRGLPVTGVPMLALLMDRDGHAQYQVRGETFHFQYVDR